MSKTFIMSKIFTWTVLYKIFMRNFILSIWQITTLNNFHPINAYKAPIHHNFAQTKHPFPPATPAAPATLLTFAIGIYYY